MKILTPLEILGKFPIEMLEPLDEATEKVLSDWLKEMRKSLERNPPTLQPEEVNAFLKGFR